MDLETAMSHVYVTTLNKLSRAAIAFAKNESGVTSIEYALIGSLIAVVILVSVTNVGSAVSGLYQRVADEVAKATK